MDALLFSSEGTEALFTDLAALRMFRLFSSGSSSIQRKVANIHRISRVGKTPNEATSHSCEQPPMLPY